MCFEEARPERPRPKQVSLQSYSVLAFDLEIGRIFLKAGKHIGPLGWMD